MKNEVNLKYKGYSGSMEISLEDQCLHGRVLFINDLVTYEGNSVPELQRAFQEAVDRYVDYCKETATQPNKPYSGSFNIRLGASLHMEAAKVAAKKGVSLNEFVRKAISDAVSPEDRKAMVQHNHTHTHKHLIIVSDKQEFGSAVVSTMSDPSGWSEQNIKNHMSH